MKEIVNVNIASISFTLEADGYARLSAYLERLDSYYKGDADRKEIVADIEARIAELILSEQSAEVSVSDATIEMIISRLGEPTESGAQEQSVAQEPQLPKRLYRKREGRRIGGVCTGLAAYFDTDPVWFRLGIFTPLILSLITSPLSFMPHDIFGTLLGGLVVTYFILWMVVPMAKTSRQKLEMHGHKITVNSIERGVKDEFGADHRVSKAAGFFAELLGIILRIVLFGVKFIAVAIGLLLAFVAALILIFIVCALAGLAQFGDVYAIEMLPLSDISFPIYLCIVLLCLLLPVLVLGVLLVNALSRRKPSRNALSIMVGIWIILFTFTTVISVRNFDALKDNINAIKVTNRNVVVSNEIRIESDSTNSFRIITNSISEEDGSNQ